MAKLTVFNHSSLDGYIADAKGDMSSFRPSAADTEWSIFVDQNTSGGATLLFGRVTYDIMAGFWPTPQAAQQMPAIAERMNQATKVVFSRTLETAAWQNTTLVKSHIAAAVRRMKEEETARGMTILGSASIVAQLAQERLIDEFHVVVNPIALGAGKTMFESIQSPLRLKLVSTRAFKNGNVVLVYTPVA